MTGLADVIFFEAFEEEEAEIRGLLPDGIRAQFTPKTIQEDGEESPPANLLSIRTQSQIPLEWAEDGRGVLTRSQGYDHLLSFQRQVEKNIACGYLGNYCARAVAEQAILTMMALLRKTKQQMRQLEVFDRDGLTGGECRGRNTLVVGVGNIGGEIADIAQGLRMHVRGVDIAPTRKEIDYVSLSEGIAWADAIFCALPLTEKTENMLNGSVLKKAKPGLVFINVGRGEISPIKDLKSLLDTGILAGIGLDVYPQEGALADAFRAGQGAKAPQGQTILELAQDDRAILTPHNAFNTKEALEQKASLTVASVVSYLENKTFPQPIPAA